MKYKFYLINTVFLALISYLFLYFFVGNIIFHIAYDRAKAKNGGSDNAIWHNPPAVPGFEPVKHTSPDIVYSYSPIIFNEDLIVVEVEVPDDSISAFWSFSVFQENSTNYFASNDMDENGKKYRKYLLAGPNSPKDVNLPGAVRIESPTNKNAMILRYIAKSSKLIPEIDKIRNKVKIYKYEGVN